MKKLFFWILLLNILILNHTNLLLASELMPGNEYLEKHQWGALEDILTDWNAGKLNTAECVIYGCYVLAAQEPARADKIEKAKLIPSKYKLNKPSVEEGPYFYIYQIHKNEDSLNKRALKEFNLSEWSDYEFVEDFTNNEKFIKVILETPLESYNNNEYRDYYIICVKALQNKVIMPQTIKYIHWLAHSGVNIKRYKNKITPFDKNYKLSLMGIPSSGFLNSLFSEFPDNNKFQNDEERFLKDRKLINTVNYLIYSRYKIGDKIE